MTAILRHDDEPPTARNREETERLRDAIAESLADPYGLPHEEVSVWLKKLAAGDLGAEMPKCRPL